MGRTGELDVDFRTEAPEEVGAVARSFRSMLDSHAIVVETGELTALADELVALASVPTDVEQRTMVDLGEIAERGLLVGGRPFARNHAQGATVGFAVQRNYDPANGS